MRLCQTWVKYDQKDFCNILNYYKVALLKKKKKKKSENLFQKCTKEQMQKSTGVIYFAEV